MERRKETLGDIGFIAFIVLVWAYALIPMVING